MIGDSWRSTIAGRGSVVLGRAQWLVIEWRHLRLGLLNVYAPNRASSRATFWAEIALGIPSADSWCVGDDFDMIEMADDR